MFIKYGEESHLQELMSKGLIYFNPCKFFRDLEAEQMKKGMADSNDGGISNLYKKVRLDTNDGTVSENQNQIVDFIVKPCLKTPVFCIKRAKSEIITDKERYNLKVQFPKHTHALIIEDEDAFLENIRYNFRNRAFSHDIFYQNEFLKNFIDFLFYGKSVTNFYEPKKKSRYYAEFTVTLNNGKMSKLYIDDSNFYKTMFRKNLFFNEQNEFRIALPYETQEEGKKYQINQVKARLCRIDELVQS
ncbi:hypothetical protein [Clostridium ljungdahlii]|uniref:Uncharacterized protein n=1 Tax=Clostridium ljungdahlii TaxID=1538 RepID=A0A162NBN9_9CLOT|nr:hypothetical protein [Clostridium ljungdahlii]OAA91459.1 hypothetical protein WY13_00716 [Clostridium ljungdahlii]